MPTTLVGLVLFAALLTPGFISYLHRRALAPTRSLSPLVELATLTTVSLATDATAILFVALLRFPFAGAVPDFRRLAMASSREQYLAVHLGLVAGWGTGALAFSSLLAYLTSMSWVRVHLPTPAVIVDVSAWYRTFEAQPDRYVYLGCDLQDGSYVAGALQWYSTDVEETEDRALVLVSPLRRTVDGVTSDITDFSRLILSARDIARVWVTYVDELD